ncbi:MAG: hypothetical protein GY941_18995 [Planctomycetes bacterium]|nr:hypothetical protein [Planctomycetota bacterium]
MKENQRISINLVLFWTFWGLFVLSALGTLGMLFFDFGTVQKSERPILVTAFLVETAGAIGALFYSRFKLRNPNDTKRRAYDEDEQLIKEEETVSTNSTFSADEELVQSLTNILESEPFKPNLIIGIARSGLIVAGYLAKQFTEKPEIPTFSLWRSDDGEYKDAFNHVSFNRQNLGLGMRDTAKILVVDAFCVHGDALRLAKEFIIRSIDDKDVVIKTAAIILRLDTGRRQTLPDFTVKKTKYPVYAFGEKE